MSKPATLPDWATTATGSDITAPSSGKRAAGWVASESPPHNYFNWWQNLVGQWVDWLNVFESTAHTWSALQTYNSGVVGNSTTVSTNAIFGTAASVGSCGVKGTATGTGAVGLKGVGTGGGLGLDVTGGGTIDTLTVSGALNGSAGGTMAGTFTFSSDIHATSGIFVTNGIIIGSGLTVSAGAVSFPNVTPTTLSLAAGVTETTNFAKTQYWKDAQGAVHVTFDVLHAASNAWDIATLPSGSRPSVPLWFPCFGVDAGGSRLVVVSIATSGVMTVISSSGIGVNTSAAQGNIIFHPTMTVA